MSTPLFLICKHNLLNYINIMTGKDQVPNINSYYDRTLLERAVAYFVHGMFGQVRDIPQHNSDTIKFRKYGTLPAATTPLVEGVTPAGSQLSVTDLYTTVNYYGDFVTLTDKVQLETEDPLLTETAEILGDQAGDTLDQIVRDILNAGTNVIYASTATQRTDITASMKLTYAEGKLATRTLKRANAKKITKMIDASTGINTKSVPSAFVGIVHPDTTYDLKADSAFTQVKDYSNPALAMENEVGYLDEIRMIETTNAKIFANAGSSNAEVYSTLVLGANAYGVTRISGAAMQNIIKPLGSAGTADPLNQRSTSGWKATYTAIILQQTFMLRVEHGTSAS